MDSTSYLIVVHSKTCSFPGKIVFFSFRMRNFSLSVPQNACASFKNMDLSLLKLLFWPFWKLLKAFFSRICLYFQFLIACLSFLTFAVEPTLPQNRLQLAFTLVLTTVAFKFVVNQSLPRISYLTYLVFFHAFYEFFSCRFLVSFCFAFATCKRSLGQGNVFTPVCHSVQGGEGVGFPAWITGHMTRGRGLHPEEGGLHPGRGGLHPGEVGLHLGDRGSASRVRGVCIHWGHHSSRSGIFRELQLPKCDFFSTFCRKLHENERIWTPGARPWHPPWIRQWGGQISPARTRKVGGTYPTGIFPCLISSLTVRADFFEVPLSLFILLISLSCWYCAQLRIR